MEEHRHIVEAFDRELRELSGLFFRMGELAHRQVARSVELLGRADRREAAERIIADDDPVDELAERIQEQAFHLLALRQPASVDLRLVLVLYKASSNLERIADYAANIARRATQLDHGVPAEFIRSVARLGEMTGGQVRDVLTAFRERDAARALEVRDRDTEVDALYISLIRELLTYMMENHSKISHGIHVLFAVRSFERIGDHAPDIAEHVHFLIKGQMPAGRRPKVLEWNGIDEREKGPPDPSE